MSSQEIEKTITEEHVGLRLDKFLSLLPEIRTRSKAEHLIDSNLILVNKKSAKASYTLKLADYLQIKIPQEKIRLLEASDIPLDIRYEDSDIIVVNKPAGLVVHPAAGHEDGTLVNALLHHTKDLSMRFNEERPGIVHRIDKETSGLLVIAKNDSSHEFLVEEFQNRRVHRIYKAVCFGKPPTHGRIESHIGRHPTDRKRFASVSSGKWSATNFKVLKSTNELSYLELKLETGRTHQIRVHMSEKGFPLVGDNLYGSAKKIKGVSSRHTQDQIKSLKRFLLHAQQLGFIHPKSKEKMLFTSDWPHDILSLIQEWGLL